MKEESKDLIIWIKKQINLAKEFCIDPCHKNGYPPYEADYDKAMAFLDSLENIEKRLCNGGYIQDRKGNLCCHRTPVIFSLLKDEVRSGELRWDTRYKSFGILGNETDIFYKMDLIEWFEKEEK